MVVNQVDAYPWVQSLSLLKSTYQRYVLLLWVCKPCALFCEQAFRLCPNVALRFSAPSSKYLYTYSLILWETHFWLLLDLFYWSSMMWSFCSNWCATASSCRWISMSLWLGVLFRMAGHSCTLYWSCILYSWMEEMMGPISRGWSCPCSIFGSDPSWLGFPFLFFPCSTPTIEQWC